MEEQRIKSISKSFRRLLSVFLLVFFTSNFYGQTKPQPDFSRLKIFPSDNQDLYTKTDLRFTVVIPQIKPSQIQILSVKLPSDVSFKTMRKQEDYESNGTLIELWINFDKKGEYQLSALPVLIQNRRISITFAPVSILEDPAKQSPALVIEFPDGTRISSKDDSKAKPVFSAKVGEKQKLTVYVQYITQVVQFSWDIPKDSIFTQTETFDIAEIKYREKNYTHDLIPVATFEWTGLKPAVLPMVKLRTTVTDYNGYRNELLLPECYVNFSEGTTRTNSSGEDYFDNAFTKISFNSDKLPSVEITESDCSRLAKLYLKEQNSFFKFSQNHKQRTDFETSLGLPSTDQGNFSKGYLYITSICSLVFLIIFLLSLKHHKKLLMIVTSIVFISTLIPIGNFMMKLTDTFAICKGCTIHSVPEEKAEAISEIGAGNKVQITEEAGKWIYINFGETGGWCLKDNVIIIK